MEQAKERIAKVDYEGCFPFWWYVCEECHGTLNEQKDREKCPHCGWRLNWEGWGFIAGGEARGNVCDGKS